MSQVRKWLRYNALFRPLAVLPPPLAYRAAARIGLRAGRAAAQAPTRTALAAVFRRLFAERLANTGEGEVLLRRWLDNFFIMQAYETLDVFVAPKAGGAGLVTVEPQSLALLRRLKGDGRGLIIAMSHYGRLNLLLYGLALAGERLGMLTMTIDRRNPGLDAVDRRYLDFKVGTLHRFIGGSWVGLDDDLRRLYRALRRGETMVILFDAFDPQNRGRRQAAPLRLPFLGGTLAVSRGISRLAAKTGARVVYGAVRQDAERGYRASAELRPLPATPEQALAAAAAELQKDVIRTPWQWWQWGILDHLWTPPCGVEKC